MRIWALVWAVIIVGTSLLGRGQSFCGDHNAYSNWIMLPFLYSLLMGCRTYPNELAQNRIDFLYSQPIGWKRILLAKALFGLIIPVLAAALAAAIFRVSCGEQYTAFATVSRLAESVRTISWIAWTSYLMGLFCSVVFAELVGGIVVIMVCVIITFGISIASIAGSPMSENERVFELAISHALLVLCPAFAALSLLRFGLSLPLSSRIKRYGLAMMVVLPILPVLSLTLPKDFVIPRISRWDSDWASVGPYRKMALVHGGWYMDEWIGGLQNYLRFREHNYIAKLSDGKTAPVDINLPTDSQYFWMDSHTVYLYSPYIGVQILRMAPSGRLITTTVKVGGDKTQILPSPDGRVVMIASQGQSSKMTLEFVNIKAARKLNAVLHEVTAYWWQTSYHVGYLDGHGRQHTLNLQL